MILHPKPILIDINKLLLNMESKRKRLIIVIIGSIIIASGISIPLTYLFLFGSFNTQELAQVNTGGGAYDLEVHGDIAYVVDTADSNPGGLVLINVSNPYHPYILGSYYQSGLPMTVDATGDIAYLANRNLGLEILNVSDPSNPIKIEQYTGSGEIYDVQVIGDIAYFADWSNGLVILNVSNPYDVNVINNYPISGACIHLHVYNNLAYITDHYSSYTGIRIINVSNPYSLVQEGYYNQANIDFWNPIVVDDRIYVANHGSNGGDFYILDATDLLDIQQLSVYNKDGTIFSYSIVGNEIYFADYERGLVVVDYTDLTNPIIVGRHFDGGHAYDVEVIGDIAYVADRDDGLEIIKIQI
jgi:hypothetical protein